MKIYRRILALFLSICSVSGINVAAQSNDEIDYANTEEVFWWDGETENPEIGEISYYMGGDGSLVEVDNEHGKSFAVDSTQRRQIVHFKTAPSESIADIVSFDVCINGASSYAALSQESGSPDMKRMFSFDNAGKINYYRGMQGQDLNFKVATPSYNKKQWYRMSAFIDYEDRTIAYYLDGEYVAMCSLPDDYKRMEGFYYTVNTDNGSTVVYLDNISIMQVKETGKPIKVADRVGVIEKFNRKSQITSDALGQIFFDKNILFNINPINLYPKSHTYSIKYNVKNEYGRIVYSNQIESEVEGNSQTDVQLPAAVDKYGFYSLNVEMHNIDHEEDCIKKQMYFSVVNKPAEGVRNNYMAVCSHTGRGEGAAEIERKVALFANAGFSALRDGYEWREVEQASGVYNFTKYDEYDNTMKEYGIKRFQMVFGGRDNISGEYVPRSNEAIAAYAKYAAAIVKSRSSYIDEIEIWNEYNLVGNSSFNPDNGTVQDYINMLKETYKEVKAANPDIFVWGAGGICSLPTSGMPWLEEFFSLKGADYCDGISIHPYSGTGGPEKSTEYIQNVAELAAKYGYENIPILSSEVGWNTTVVSDNDQANYAVRHAASAMGKVKTMYWYNDQEKDTATSDSEKKFGMIRGWTEAGAAPYPTYSAKPMFAALSNWNALMTDTAPINNFDLNGSAMYLFDKKDSPDNVAVVWNEEALPQNIGIKLNTDKITVYDIYGNAEKIEAVNGVFNVGVSKSPIYIEGAFDNAEYTDALSNVSTQSIEAVVNDRVSFTVTKTFPQNAKVVIECPENITVISNDGFDAAGVANIALSTGDAPSSGEHITVKVVSEDESVLYSEHIIEVLYRDIVNYKVYAKPSEPRRWEYKIDITNMSNTQCISGKINIKEPDYIAKNNSEILFDEMRPGETRTFGFAIPETMNDVKSSVKMVITLDNGLTYDFGDDVYFAVLGETMNPPAIDGKFSDGEWNYNMTIPLKFESQVQRIPNWSPDNLSGNIYLMWDRENFYLAAKVIDDVDAATGTALWQNDSMQFAFANEKRADGKRTEYAIGILDGKPAVERYSYMIVDYGTIGVKDAFESGDIQVAISREESTKTTYYEAKIPWEQIYGTKINPNMYEDMVFSLLINDNDGNGRTGWLEYCPGIGAAKDIMQFIRVPMYKKFGARYK